MWSCIRGWFRFSVKLTRRIDVRVVGLFFDWPNVLSMSWGRAKRWNLRNGSFKRSMEWWWWISIIIHFSWPRCNNDFFPFSFVRRPWTESERSTFAFAEDLGIYSSSLQRQLFDLHHTLLVDRPEVRSPLLNSQVLSFVSKVEGTSLSIGEERSPSFVWRSPKSIARRFERNKSPTNSCWTRWKRHSTRSTVRRARKR